ncbi:MAG TPA: MFS transporter [Opitutaceae bacterium]|nr:MFS transporter [Opitutaceae bacterium]
MSNASTQVSPGAPTVVGGLSTHAMKTVAVLGSGHFIVDLCQGVLPLTLPFLLTRLRLDYMQASLVVSTAYVTSSITQPAFGLLRWPWGRRATLWLGVPLACAGLAAIMVADSYAALLVAVVVSSAGTAMFHPEAVSQAHLAGGTQGAKSMSFFVMCGSIGFTSGAMIFGPLLAAYGLGSLGWLLVPGLLFPWLLRMRSGGAAGPRVQVASRVAAGEIARRMGIPVAVAALRQCAMAGLIALLPLYFTVHLRQPAQVGGWMMFALQLGSNLGMFAYGFMEPRFGRGTLLRVGLLVSVPLLLVFPYTTGMVTAGLLLLAGIGLALPVMAIALLGQVVMPENRALAASLILGLGIGLGGITSGLLGRVADHWGIVVALQLAGLLPLGSAALSLRLPKGL